MTQQDREKKDEGKKWTETQGPVGQYPDGGERERQKNICRNDWYCPKFGEGYSRFKFRIQGQQILSKINMKKIIPRHITAKLLRTKIKKILGSSQRKSDKLYIEEQQLEWVLTSHQKRWRPEDRGGWSEAPKKIWLDFGSRWQYRGLRWWSSS